MSGIKKIRIGQIGTAHDHASGKMACARKFPDIFDVVCISEPDEALRRQAQKSPIYAGLKWVTEDELLESGLDAVMVENFELDLVSAAQRCVDRGLHVHVDKPAGDDIAAFRKLLSDAKAKNLCVQMAYMYRYNPAVLDCVKKIKDGVLGEIYEVDAIMDTAHDPGKRRWLGKFDAGIMFFLGCHMVDLVYMLQGTPDNIIPFRRSTGFDGVHTVDHTFAVLEYGKGISTVRATSTEINGYGRRQLVVCGSRGTYEIKPLERPIKATLSESRYADAYSDNKETLPIETVPGDSRYDDMMIDFAAVVRGEKENPFNYEYEFQLQKLILACCGQNIDYKEKVTL